MPLFRRLELLVLFACAAGCASSAAPLSPRAVELNRDGAEALERGDLEMASARLHLAIEYHPRFTEAWVNLGLLELQRGHFAEAEEALREARRLNRHLPTPHHALGLLAEQRNDSHAAKYHYKEALEVDPGFAPARINYGRLLFADARFEDAREQFLRLTEVAPLIPAGWSGLVQSLLRLRREEDADAALERAPLEAQTAPELLLLSARRAARSHKESEAREILQSLIQSDEVAVRAEALSWLALLELGTDDRASAARHLEEARLLTPNSDLVREAAATMTRRSDRRAQR